MAILNLTTATKLFSVNNHTFFPKSKDHFKLNCPPWIYSLRSGIGAQSESESESERTQDYSVSADSGLETADIGYTDLKNMKNATDNRLNGPSTFSLFVDAHSVGWVKQFSNKKMVDRCVTTNKDNVEVKGLFPSARARMDLLEQLTSSSSGSSSVGKRSIREQLAELIGDRDDDFSIPLGKDLKKVSPKFLTTSQKRNIRRQDYLTEVSQRNDSVFFATIGAFVILPPILILGIAILTGYVQLFP